MTRASLAIFSAFWQIVLTYRGMMVIQAVRLLLLPVVLLSAWLSIEKMPGNPYSDADYLLYYLLVPFILNITDSRSIFKFASAVKDGSLSRDLLKPYPAPLLFLIETVTGNLVQLVYLLPMTIAGLFFFRQRLPQIDFNYQLVTYFGLALAGGAILRMLVSGSIALLGFWLENVTTLNLVLNGGIWALLGGMIVPVATFPDTIREIAGYLPYRYMLSFPIEILTGRLGHDELISGFLVILAWSAIFGVLCRGIWCRGLKAFTAYGG